jgi:hypothetical protein
LGGKQRQRAAKRLNQAGKGEEMDFLYNILQNQRIAENARTSEKADEKASSARDGVQDLRKRIETLALANQALFEILSERLGIKEEDVISRMLAIDLRDGKKDGKITWKAILCRQCGRTVSTSRLHCVYCGASVTDGPVFGKR